MIVAFVPTKRNPTVVKPDPNSNKTSHWLRHHSRVPELEVEVASAVFDFSLLLRSTM